MSPNEAVIGRQTKLRHSVLCDISNWSLVHEGAGHPEVISIGHVDLAAITVIIFLVPSQWSHCKTSISQNPQCIIYPTMDCFVTEICTCAHFCYKMVHCGIWDWCIVGFLGYVYSFEDLVPIDEIHVCIQFSNDLQWFNSLRPSGTYMRL